MVIKTKDQLKVVLLINMRLQGRPIFVYPNNKNHDTFPTELHLYSSLQELGPSFPQPLIINGLFLPLSISEMFGFSIDQTLAYHDYRSFL